MAGIQVIKASTCWREFFPYCLWDGERIEDIVSSLTPEEWDDRWQAANEDEAPQFYAWNDDWVFFSRYDDGLKVYRAPRNPNPDATPYQPKQKGDRNG